MKKLVKYVKRNGKVLGCLVGVGYDGREEGFSLGWSKFHYGEEQGKFDKKKALEIATGMAVNDYPILFANPRLQYNQTYFPSSFLSEAEEFIERCQRYFHVDYYPNNWND